VEYHLLSSLPRPRRSKWGGESAGDGICRICCIIESPNRCAGRLIRRRLIGRTIVTGDAICHGKPTFIGTRIMAWQVLEFVADNMDWDGIIREFQNSITREAIAEASSLANQTFQDHAREYAAAPISA
jgi:uncharacterized protein (DUF433 family)